ELRAPTVGGCTVTELAIDPVITPTVTIPSGVQRAYRRVDSPRDARNGPKRRDLKCCRVWIIVCRALSQATKVIGPGAEHLSRGRERANWPHPNKLLERSAVRDLEGHRRGRRVTRRNVTPTPTLRGSV